MKTKTCKKCHITKSTDDFYKHKTNLDGLMGSCKGCKNLYSKQNKHKYTEKRKEYSKDYYRKNKDNAEYINRRINYRQENATHIARQRQLYKTFNKDKILAEKNKHRADKINRTPVWADLEEINEFYKEVKQLEQLTGIRFHVDHIVPLRGENVCGLHVGNNLQILTAEENLRKGNLYET